MALVYGGLCAGATSAKASIAASTASSTRCTPVRFCAWTALNPIAETSAASASTPISGSVNWSRQSCTASPWSAIGQTCSRSPRADLVTTLAFVRPDPLDRPAGQDRLGRVGQVEEAVLEAGAAQVGDEDLQRCAASDERPDDRRVGPRDDVGGAQLADPAGRLGTGLDRGADAADVAPDHHAHDAAVELDHRAGQLDARRLEHRIHRMDQPDQAQRLDQAQGIPVHDSLAPLLLDLERFTTPGTSARPTHRAEG